ncbi:MAG: hypothetical protein JXR78_06165 [Victivallales bacterium]|nr:hypothetical protein [Victivallales bacterium]
MFQSEEHNILPDAERVQTKAIQNLIDRCAVKGGGEIVFTPGDYVTGTLELCNNLTLRFERGARLLDQLPEAITNFSRNRRFLFMKEPPELGHCYWHIRNMGLCSAVMGLLMGRARKFMVSSNVQRVRE